MDIQRITHVGICVSDLEKSTRFWREVFELEEVGRLEMSGPGSDTLNQMQGSTVRAVYLERDGWRIELIAWPTPGHIGSNRPRPMNQLGLTHLSFRVADLDAVCARIEAMGGGVIRESWVGAPGVPRGAVMVHDPDGTRIELVCGPGDPNRVPGSPKYMVDD